MKSETIQAETEQQPIPLTIEDEMELVSHQEPEDESTDNGEPPARQKRWLRRVLLLLGPLLLLTIGGYVYLTGGRYAETDNAYIKADKVSLSAQVSGPITKVLIKENQHVVKGQELFVIDDTPFRVALNRAQARQQGVRAFVSGLKAGYYQKQAQLKRDQTDMKYNEREYKRQLELSRKHLASDSDLDNALHDMQMAQQQIDITQKSLDQIAAQLGGDPKRPLEEHPLFKETQGAVDDALLNIKWTHVRSPFTGVASKKPELGQYIRAGEPVMAIVADKGMWIEANYKETELTYVRPGQDVRIWVDTYPDQEWHGTVASLSQASGAEFSLLPPQNSTGNWVKVVQRIPVRINIDPRPGAPQLRAGMSTTVSIDTHHHRLLPAFLRDALSTLGIKSAAAYTGN